MPDVPSEWRGDHHGLVRMREDRINLEKNMNETPNTFTVIAGLIGPA
jgi:hypothetical protein